MSTTTTPAAPAANSTLSTVVNDAATIGEAAETVASLIPGATAANVATQITKVEAELAALKALFGL